MLRASMLSSNMLLLVLVLLLLLLHTNRVNVSCR
jgi:hypothetical protein